MKTPLRLVTIAGLAIAELTWPSFNAIAQEGEDLDARASIRQMELQDENGQIPSDALTNAYADKDAMPFLPEAWSEFVTAEQIQTGVKGGSWVSIGPGNVGGRIRSIIIRPPVDPFEPQDQRTMWAGAVTGGVWKSTNSGELWSTNTDRLANLAVNCMAIEPGYHAPGYEVLYAGTGEGFFNVDYFKGNGIFKTTDGGTTWNHLEFTRNNPDFVLINRLAISPTNPQLLLAVVAVEVPGLIRGKILRSTNGGTTWTTATTNGGPLFPSGMTDVRFKPSSTASIPDVPSITCLASTRKGHIYFSTDDGATWETRDNNSGLPEPTDNQRVELAYSRSNPLIVYASKADGDSNTPNFFALRMADSVLGRWDIQLSTLIKGRLGIPMYYG